MRAVIFANGVLSDPAGAKKLLDPQDILIAADGGARHCRTLGLNPDTIIGDMDSLTPAELEEFEQRGAQLITFPSDKNETDLELALLHARRLGAKEILILAGLGRRWDQTLANILLPAYHRLTSLSIAFWEAGQWLYLVSEQLEITTQPGSTVSLIPIAGDALGVTATGLQWPLTNETLHFGASRGVSNQMQAASARISLDQGLLLVVVGSKD